jgi:hypothetical protein
MMTDNYLQIMLESLEKKIDLLNQIIEIDDRQLNCAYAKPMDMEGFDSAMDEKDVAIDELNKLDEGFTSTYELVKDEIQKNPQLYEDKIHKLQELIKISVEKIVSVETKEKRNKAAMENVISLQRKEIQSKRMSASAAARYYKTASKINSVDPQLMDRKK